MLPDVFLQSCFEGLPSDESETAQDTAKSGDCLHPELLSEQEPTTSWGEHRSRVRNEIDPDSAHSVEQLEVEQVPGSKKATPCNTGAPTSIIHACMDWTGNAVWMRRTTTAPGLTINSNIFL